MRILNETQNKLAIVYDILSDVATKDSRINSVRYSPNKTKLILDIKFNKALEVFYKGNELIIQGELNLSSYVQNILNKYLNN